MTIMQIALLDDQTILQVGHYKTLFPATSFPVSGPSAEFLADNNAKEVNNYLSFDHETEKLEDCPPYINGDVVSTVHVVPLTQWELDKRVESRWAAIRSQRNQLLQESDWTQLPDSPVDKTVWATYRQELRDITDQEDPFSIVWPVDPNYVPPLTNDES